MLRPPLESSRRDGSNEGSQHIFSLRNKKYFSLNYPQYPLLSEALWHERFRSPCTSQIIPFKGNGHPAMFSCFAKGINFYDLPFVSVKDEASIGGANIISKTGGKE